MERFESLLKIVSKAFPDDWWILSLENSKSVIDVDEALSRKIEIYSKALECLDSGSWQILLDKATEKFKADSIKRGKQQFFNLLNEAFAYQFLIENGFKNVKFVKENTKAKTPDIQFIANNIDCFCEVKTIGISDEEIRRYESEDVIDSSIYTELGDGFFRKLSSNIDISLKQIGFVSSQNIIYMIVSFDDFTGFNYTKYKNDIQEYIEKNHPMLQIYIRVDIENRFFIHTKPQIA